MPRKNTAEAFEVLYRIAEERKQGHRAALVGPASDSSRSSPRDNASLASASSVSAAGAKESSSEPVGGGAVVARGEVEILGRGAPPAAGQVPQPGLPRIWGKEQFPLVRIPRDPLLKGAAPTRKSLASVWGLPSGGSFLRAGSAGPPVSGQVRGSIPGQWMARNLRSGGGLLSHLPSERRARQGRTSSAPWIEEEVEPSGGPASPWKREALEREWALRRTRASQGVPAAGGGEPAGAPSREEEIGWTGPGSLDPLAISGASSRQERWLDAVERAALLSAYEPVCAACGAPCARRAEPGAEAAEDAGGRPPQRGESVPEISCLEAKGKPPQRPRPRRPSEAAGGPPVATAPAAFSGADAVRPGAPAHLPADFPEDRKAAPPSSVEDGADAPSRQEPRTCDEIAEPAPPLESAPPVPARRACPGGDSRAPATDVAPRPSAATLPGASPGFLLGLRGKVADWVLGGRLSAKLERRIEVKFSTVLGFSMAAVTTVFVILIYLQTPSKEDPRFSSLESTEGAVWRNLDVPATDEGAGPRRGAQERKDILGSRAAPADRRLLPILRPITSPQVQGAGEGRPSEVRSVERAAPGTEAAVEPPVAAVASRDSDATASPYVYLIQVRAKESAEGAQRIIEYLQEFGFQENLVQTDPRGDRNVEGQLLHTVFVGSYFDKDQAERECERLKRETRLRPYKGKTDFFRDALVITRRR